MTRFQLGCFLMGGLIPILAPFAIRALGLVR